MKKYKRYEELENVMALKGLSKQALALKTGVSEERIKMILNGKSEFTIHEAEKISKTLDLKHPTKYFFK